ncbi:MAG TPA: hypothetical protein VGI39_30430 [Polyangiaceae bacterium]|jgi:hypothetical protein
MTKLENTVQPVETPEVKTPQVPRLLAGVAFTTASSVKKAVSTRWRG